MLQARRALVSVYDKRGLEDFARGLARLGVEIVSTGGTLKFLPGEGHPGHGRVRRHRLSRRSSTAGSRRSTRASTAASWPTGGGRPPRPDPGARHRAHRPRGREPLSLPRDPGLRRFLRADDRDDRHRRARHGPRRGQELRRRGAWWSIPGTMPRCSPLWRRAAASSPEELRRRLAAKAFGHTQSYDAASRPACRGRREPAPPARRARPDDGAALRREPPPVRRGLCHGRRPRRAGRLPAASGQGAVLEQPPGCGRRPQDRRPVRGAGGGHRQAQQPVRRRPGSGSRGGLPSAPSPPIRSRRSARSWPSTVRRTAPSPRPWPTSSWRSCSLRASTKPRRERFGAKKNLRVLECPLYQPSPGGPRAAPDRRRLPRPASRRPAGRSVRLDLPHPAAAHRRRSAAPWTSPGRSAGT